MPNNNNLAEAVRSSLITHNTETGHAWTFGTNWDNQGTQFETYVNKYLFPKLNETLIIESILGNRFNWLAKETDFIGQYSEEYVILDSVPIELDLSKNAELMLNATTQKWQLSCTVKVFLKKLNSHLTIMTHV